MRPARRIPFNVPYLTGQEGNAIQELLASGSISSNGKYTKSCEAFFRDTYGYPEALLTSSGTSALEMAALLLGVGPGDEVIMPSYTFTSTANAFALRGARIVFADSGKESPNIDVELLETLVTDRTRAIVVVHYGGVACDMERLQQLCKAKKIVLIEDAAQAIDASYKGKPLGAFGAMSTFSFHETKNIVAGECGLLVLNDLRFVTQAEIIREKGTNRSAFFRGETDKYTWCSLGSSFLPSELASALLWAQLKELNFIQQKRLSIWSLYDRMLQPLVKQGWITLAGMREGCQHNASVFYFVVESDIKRNKVLTHLGAHGIGAAFHYQALHRSPYFVDQHDGRPLPQAERYTQCLIRLPLYPTLTEQEVEYVTNEVENAFNNN